MSRIVEIRKRKGMKQKELAELCGVTQKTISAIEKKRRNPSYKLLVRMTKVLDVSADELIGDDDDKGRTCCEA